MKRFDELLAWHLNISNSLIQPPQVNGRNLHDENFVNTKYGWNRGSIQNWTIRYRDEDESGFQFFSKDGFTTTRQPGVSTHPHPILADWRKIMEITMYNLIREEYGDTVAVVQRGGNFLRAHDAGLPCFSLNMIQDTIDYDRQLKYMTHLQRNTVSYSTCQFCFCGETGKFCPHVLAYAKGRLVVFMDVDSGYYGYDTKNMQELTRDYLAEGLSPVSYYCAHVFTAKDVSKPTFREIRELKSNANKLLMLVEGNTQPYVHTHISRGDGTRWTTENIHEAYHYEYKGFFITESCERKRQISTNDDHYYCIIRVVVSPFPTYAPARPMITVTEYPSLMLFKDEAKEGIYACESDATALLYDGDIYWLQQSSHSIIGDKAKVIKATGIRMPLRIFQGLYRGMSPNITPQSLEGMVRNAMSQQYQCNSTQALQFVQIVARYAVMVKKTLSGFTKSLSLDTNSTDIQFKALQYIDSLQETVDLITSKIPDNLEKIVDKGITIINSINSLDNKYTGANNEMIGPIMAGAAKIGADYIVRKQKNQILSTIFNYNPFRYRSPVSIAVDSVSTMCIAGAKKTKSVIQTYWRIPLFFICLYALTWFIDVPTTPTPAPRLLVGPKKYVHYLDSLPMYTSDMNKTFLQHSLEWRHHVLTGTNLIVEVLDPDWYYMVSQFVRILLLIPVYWVYLRWRSYGDKAIVLMQLLGVLLMSQISLSIYDPVTFICSVLISKAIMILTRRKQLIWLCVYMNIFNILYVILASIRVQSSPMHVIPSSCTPNNIDNMLRVLTEFGFLYDIRTGYGMHIRGTQYPITMKSKVQKSWILECDKALAVDNTDLKQKCPIMIGYQNRSFKPFKLHNCFRNSTESIYRQFQNVSMKLDPARIARLKRFYKASDQYRKNVSQIPYCPVDFDLWKSELTESKRNLYMEGYAMYLDRLRDKSLHHDRLTDKDMKMKTKIDEKNFIDFKDPKCKARTITEQHAIAKCLMGPIIHAMMRIQKSDPANVSGLSHKQIGKKMSMSNLKFNAYLPQDFSGFDSTQLAPVQEAIDNTILNEIINANLSQIAEYADVDDVRKICFNTTQSVNNDYYRYEIEGTIPSGIMKTSACNGERARTYVREVMAYVGAVEGVDFEFYNLGDDVHIYSDLQTLDNYKRAAYDMSYIIRDIYDATTKPGAVQRDNKLALICRTILISENIHDTDFLSCDFITDKDGNVKLVRKLPRLLQLTPWTDKNTALDPATRLRNARLLAYDEGKQISTWCGKLHLYSNLANMLMRLGLPPSGKEDDRILETLKDNSLKYTNRSDDRWDDSYNDDLLRLLWDRYNISKDEVDELSSKLDAETDLLAVISCSLIDKFSGDRDPMEIYESLNPTGRGCKLDGRAKIYDQHEEYLDLINQK